VAPPDAEDRSEDPLKCGGVRSGLGRTLPVAPPEVEDVSEYRGERRLGRALCVGVASVAGELESADLSSDGGGSDWETSSSGSVESLKVKFPRLKCGGC